MGREERFTSGANYNDTHRNRLATVAETVMERVGDTLLADEVNSREIDDFIPASIENGLQHEKAKVPGLLVGDRGRHRKLLT